MAEPIPLDLVILHDSIDYFLSSTISRSIQERFDINPQKREEYLLGFPEKFSSRVEQDSLVYVHGGRLANHRNFDRLLSISAQRPDLRWIVEFDPCMREIFPENGLFYVHGGLLTHHANFDLVCQISPQRPDLKFIVEFDDRVQRDNFSSPETYQMYREGLRLDSAELLKSEEAVRNTNIIIHTLGINRILAYPTPSHQTDFQQYLSMLLQVRRSS